MNADRKTAGLVALVSILVFANCLQNKFVYDDTYFITDNVAIRNLSGMPLFFTSLKSFSPAGNFYIYRPLSTLSYAVDYGIAKLNPFMFHLSSVIWHALACVMLYFLLKAMFKDKKVPLVATLLFSVHPVQTESVAWASQRSNLISLFFFLLAFYLWLRNNTAGSAVSYFFALLGKEMAITLPLVLILYDGFFQPKADKGLAGVVGVKWKRYLPFLIVAAFYIILRTAVLGRISGQNEFAGGSLHTAIPIMAKAILFYARLLAVPVDLCVERTINPAVSLAEPGVIVSILFLALLSCLCVSLFRKRRTEGFFISWFLVTLLPVSNLIPLQDVVVAERFLYFPSIGFCVLLSMSALRPGRERKISVLLLSFLMIFYASLTINRNRVWKDGLSLWNDTLRKTPSNNKALTGLGSYYIERGDYGEAIGFFKRAISLKPDDAESYYNLGTIYGKLSMYADAVASYRRSINLIPGRSGAYYNLGWTYEMWEHYDDAIASYLEAIKLNPDDVRSYCNLGSVYVKLHRHADALASYEKAILLKGDYAIARYNLASLYLALGEKGAAREQYEILKKIDTNLADKLSSLSK